MLVEHWDGRQVRLVRLPGSRGPTPGLSVDASSPANVWVVADGFVRWNGARWIAASTRGLAALDGVDGLAVMSPRSAWAIGHLAHNYETGVLAAYTP